MTLAEEVASLWDGVSLKPKKGAEKAYYADLLRKVMVSKKQLEETGRKYSILPDLRELTRRTLVRIPAEHVPYLEISVFDLISNPLKKNLQPFVSEFSANGADLELVLWFVRHAKKEPTLALDYKALQTWLDEQTKPSDSSGPSASGGPAAMAPTPPAQSVAPPSSADPSDPSCQASTTEPSSASDSPSDSSASIFSPDSSSTSASPTDTAVATPPLPESDGTNADRIFEHD